MSLLNDALRKKQNEINNPGAVPLVKNMPGVVKTSHKKKYYVAFVLFLFFSVVAYGSWRFFIQPVYSPNEKMLTKRFREEPTLKEHSVNEKAAPINVDDVPKTAVLSPAAEKAEPAPEKIQNSASNNIVKDKLLEPKPDPLIEKKKTASTLKVQKKNTITLKTGIKEQNKISQKKRSSSAELTPVDTMFYKKAVSYHKSDDLKKSIQMYEKVVRNNPDFVPARFNLAAAYIQEGMFSKAYPVLKQLLEKDPENPKIILNLAIVEIGLNNPESAIEYLGLAESKQGRPNFAIYFHLGIANSKIDNFTDALIWYNKAKNIEPQNSNLFFNLGIVYERLKEYSKAINHYERSLIYGDSFSSKQRRHIGTRIQALKRFLISQ